MEILENDPRLDSEIFNALMDTGIPANISGYHHLKEVLSITVLNPKAVLKAREKLYTPIAEATGVSPSSVQSAIRNAIRIGWGRADEETLSLYFGFAVDRTSPLPTTSKYIATISERIRIRLNIKGKETLQPFEDEIIDDKVSRLLYNLKIMGYFEGYLYMKYAIKLAIQNNMIADQLIPSIYAPVADGFLTTVSYVKHIMSRCVDIMWREGTQALFPILYGFHINLTLEKPTIGELLAAAVKGIQLDLQAEIPNYDAEDTK